MKELISAAVLVATLYGGSLVGDQILRSIRETALTKAARGLPRLLTLSQVLTKETKKKPRDERQERNDSDK